MLSSCCALLYFNSHYIYFFLVNGTHCVLSYSFARSVNVRNIFLFGKCVAIFWNKFFFFIQISIISSHVVLFLPSPPHFSYFLNELRGKGLKNRKTRIAFQSLVCDSSPTCPIKLFVIQNWGRYFSDSYRTYSSKQELDPQKAYVVLVL